MVQKMDAQHIAAGAGGFEPQRVNNFMLRCTPPGAGNTQVIELALQAFPFAKSVTAVETIAYLNEERKYAGRTTFPNGELVLKDYVDQDTLRVMMDWRKKVFDPTTGRTGLASAYKVDAHVLMFGPDGNNERKWELQGVWPSEDNAGSGAMGDASHNLLTFVMVVDLIVPENV